MPNKRTKLSVEAGERLRRTRLALGYATVREFAKVAGTPERNVYAWEIGQNLVSVDFVGDLKARFGVTSDWIFYGDPSALPHSLHANIVTRAA